MKNPSASEDPPRPLYRCGSSRRDLAEPISLIVLGATGSIGRQTLELVKSSPARLQVVALSCRERVQELLAIWDELVALQGGAEAPLLAVSDAEAWREAAALPRVKGKLLAAGADGLIEAVTRPQHADCLVNGLVGAAGLAPTLAGVRRGLRIALANKESLVIGGDLVREALHGSQAEIIPVDSEHSAIAQCLSGRRENEIQRLILTASGGPFRHLSADQLAKVTLAEVLDHPTWNMGRKITVDSATMMNKGLEIIEAHHLFGLPYEQIDVAVHPGSYVHSLVEFVDGAIMAQLGTPDMRLPLQYAIAGEKHWPLATGRLDLLAVGSLHFEAPDFVRFSCLRLAREAGLAGGNAPVVLNAANEVAVAALLAGRIHYVDIARIIAESLAAVAPAPVHDLAGVLAVDARARAQASDLVAKSAH